MAFDVCDLLSTVQALFVRLLFLIHSVFAIWAATCVTGRPQLWALTVLCGLFIVETIVSIVKRKGREMKWLSPCVLIYLLSVIPPIWLLNLDMFHCMQTRLDSQSDTGSCISIHGGNSTVCTFFSTQSYFDRKPLVYTIEEVMLLLLILGRWLLPKGSVTHDQLSLLLLVYFGIAFDIMELFYLLDEPPILASPTMIYVILGIWTFSLFQFVVVLTTVKRQRARLSMETRGGRGIVHRLTACQCCHSEVWGLLTNVIMQDGPFLILRIYCLAGLKVFSYNLLFYTMKNVLVVMLQFYRLAILALRTLRPGFDENPIPRAPSVEILGPVAPSGGERSRNRAKPMTAAAAALGGWSSSQRSLDSSSNQKMLNRTNSSERRLDRTNSQDFAFVSHV